MGQIYTLENNYGGSVEYGLSRRNWRGRLAGQLCSSLSQPNEMYFETAIWLTLELVYLPAQRQEAEPLACATAAETVCFPLLPHFLLSVAPVELPGSSLEQRQRSYGKIVKKKLVLISRPAASSASVLLKPSFPHSPSSSRSSAT